MLRILQRYTICCTNECELSPSFGSYHFIVFSTLSLFLSLTLILSILVSWNRFIKFYRSSTPCFVLLRFGNVLVVQRCTGSSYDTIIWHWFASPVCLLCRGAAQSLCPDDGEPIAAEQVSFVYGRCLDAKPWE